MKRIKSFFSRSGFKSVIIIALAVMLAMAGVSIFGGVKYSTDIGADLNPDNLIDAKAEGYIDDMNTGYGVKIKVDDEGVIKLSGKASDSYSVNIASVELEAGTYTISGLSNTDSINDCALLVSYGNGGAAFAGTDSATFTLTETQTVTVKLQWAEDYWFSFLNNGTVKPVLVKGDTAGDFYAD